MPVFRDWDVARILCQQIDQEIAQLHDVDVGILLVDDGSPVPMQGWSPFEPQHISRVDVLLLQRNLGHQRAIAMGLCMVKNEIQCDAVLVMDADGEDRPQDVVRLLNCFRENPECVVFAGRQRRYESLVFRTGYKSYQLLHRVLTGMSVREGNFSIMPRSALDRLITMSELWNHYAGAIFKAKLKTSGFPPIAAAASAANLTWILCPWWCMGLPVFLPFTRPWVRDSIGQRFLCASALLGPGRRLRH